jgi:heme exporter protein D
MQWNSVGEFFAMGGYALYVWGSFGVCAAAMVIEPLLVGKRNRDILASLRRERLADELEKQQS